MTVNRVLARRIGFVLIAGVRFERWTKEPMFHTRRHRLVMLLDEPGIGPHGRPGPDVPDGLPAPERVWGA